MTVEELPERFFTPEELRGALVVDSEGFIYGLVEGVFFQHDYAALDIVIKTRMGETVVDEAELRAKLILKGYDVEDKETLEDLVALAKIAGIEVPRKVADKEIKLRKAVLPVSEIKWIDEKTINIGGEEERLKVVLLKTPREASYRGIQPQPKPVSPVPDDVKGKLVLSNTRGIMGVALEVTIGFGVPGIRVYTRKVEEKEISWISFIANLRRMGLSELAEKMQEIADPYKTSRIPYSRMDEIKKRLKKLNAPSQAIELLESSVVEGEKTSIYTDISWTNVKRVSDVILVD